MQSKRGAWPPGIEGINKGTLGSIGNDLPKGTGEIFQVSSFPLLSFYPWTMLLSQESASVGTFRGVSTVNPDQRLAAAAVHAHKE